MPAFEEGWIAPHTRAVFLDCRLEIAYGNVRRSIVKDLRAAGIPILLVEQNVAAALKIADRAYIMETGRIVTHGSAAALLGDDEVRKRYLGM